MKKIEGDYLINYIDQGFENMNPRDELPKVYIRSGAIYAILTKNFYEEQSLVSNLCSPIILDKIETINIDSPLDFKFCEFILNQNKMKTLFDSVYVHNGGGKEILDLIIHRLIKRD